MRNRSWSQQIIDNRLTDIVQGICLVTASVRRIRPKNLVKSVGASPVFRRHVRDLRDKTRLLFRDVTYFRDAPDNAALAPSELSLLNFRSPQFSGTFIKAYGHFGLFVPDYLADFVSQQKGGK